MSKGMPRKVGLWTLINLNQQSNSWSVFEKMFLTFNWNLISAINIRGRNKGWPPVNDQLKTPDHRLEFFTANYLHSESFDKAYNFSLLYWNMYILSQNSQYLSMFNSWKKYSVKLCVKKKNIYSSQFWR